MKLIVGLGNPGSQYAASRHNVGFRVVDRIMAAQGWKWDGKRDRALLAQGTIAGQKVVLAKPQTYMNDSGASVGPLVRFYKIDVTLDLLVICDDLDLPVGKVRVRAKGSAGGQHGMESVISQVGSSDFARIRVGIGRPANPHIDTISHVLGVAQGDEALALAAGETRAFEAAMAWITEGAAAVMNRYNADPQPPKQERGTVTRGTRKGAEDAEGETETESRRRRNPTEETEREAQVAMGEAEGRFARDTQE